MPRVVPTNRAIADLASFPQDLRETVDLDILLVGADPRENGAHLKGTWFCRWSRYTAGNRRVLYRIDGRSGNEVVYILGIPHRNVAYPRARH